MLQDIQAGRKTEIDFLNGAILRLADQAELTAPRHATITQIIKAREAAGVEVVRTAMDAMIEFTS